jgi:hypothetical protein
MDYFINTNLVFFDVFCVQRTFNIEQWKAKVKSHHGIQKTLIEQIYTDRFICGYLVPSVSSVCSIYF